MDLPDEKPRFISFHELYDSVGLSLFIVEKQTEQAVLSRHSPADGPFS